MIYNIYLPAQLTKYINTKSHMSIRLLIGITCLLSTTLFAQSNKDKDQQQLYSYLYSKQYNQAKSLINSKFLTSIEPTRKIIGYVYLADYYGEINNEEKKVEALETAKKIAQNTNRLIDQAYVNLGYTRYYCRLKQDELFIKTLNQTIKDFSAFDGEDFILTQLYFLRYNYKAKNSLENDTRMDAILANKHALASKNPLLINYTYSNLGYYYKQKFHETDDKKYIDSAVGTAEKTLHYAELIEDERVRDRSMIVYNLNQSSLVGFIEDKNNPDEILKYSLQALVIANKHKSYNDFKSFIYNNIGSNYSLREKYNEAEKYFKMAYDLVKDNQQLTNYKIKFLSNLATNAEKKGNLKEALRYLQEEKDLILEENQYQFDNSTKSLEIFYETEQANQKIKQLEDTNRYTKIQSILYVCLSIVGTAILIIIFYNVQYKRKLKVQREIIDDLKNQLHS